MNIIAQRNAHLDKAQLIGLSANQAASLAVFDIYRMTKSANTLSAQRRAFKKLVVFLSTVDLQIDASQLWQAPNAWEFMTWGLLEAYKVWALDNGLSVATLNQHLSAIKTYCQLANKAGFIDDGEMMRIKAVSGISGAKAKLNVSKRASKEVCEDKQKTTNTLTDKQVRQLERKLDKFDTPTGKRDRLLFHLLFEHGLRSSEILLLTRHSFVGDELVFDRPKVGLTGCRHRLRKATISDFEVYLDELGHDGPFWRSSKRGGGLASTPLTRSSLHRAVNRWGALIDIRNLSAHDARHSVATKLAKKGMTANQLLDFFGWNSLGTAQRYVERARIGNKGVGKIW